MASDLDLSRFWELLETNFPLAGARRDLRDSLGCDLVTALETGEVLSYVRAAERISCPRPGGAGCPRHVVELSDGRILGVCGNDPPECEDIELTQRDIEVLGVQPERLCRALRHALCMGGKIEAIAGLRNTYRAGTFKPRPTVRNSVYFVARCAEREYSEAFDALRSRQEGNSFAILVPTDRFVSVDTIRQMATLGIPIIALRGLISPDTNGQLITSEDALQLFEGIGRRAATTAGLSAPVVAQALTHEGWRDLDETSYRGLIEKVNEYSIVADEMSGVVWKCVNRRKSPEPIEDVQPGYFRMIHATVMKKGYFDPAVEGPMEEQESGKQIFQRARKAIDIKYKDRHGTTKWRLFKTAKVDNHAVYHFQPDPNFKFALIFLPRS